MEGGWGIAEEAGGEMANEGRWRESGEWRKG